MFLFAWLEFSSEKKNKAQCVLILFKKEIYVDYHITKEQNRNVLNPSKQSFKRIFVLKYSETC